MTRWDLLKNLLLSHDSRKAIGKAWPLFFYLVFHIKESNKLITSYPELKASLNESVSTIKKWRDQLETQKVIQVHSGKLSMTLTLLSPFCALTTCEQLDEIQIKMITDPSAKRLLEKVTVGTNMSLLPVILELSSKLENIEKRLS